MHTTCPLHGVTEILVCYAHHITEWNNFTCLLINIVAPYNILEKSIHYGEFNITKFIDTQYHSYKCHPSKIQSF